MDISSISATPLTPTDFRAVDRETVNRLITNANHAGLHAIEQLWNNPGFAETALRLDGENFRWVPREIKDDEDLLKIALISFPTAYYYASPRLEFRYRFDYYHTLKLSAADQESTELVDSLSHDVRLMIRTLITRCPTLLESALYVAQNSPDLVRFLPVESALLVAENRPDFIPYLRAELRNRLDVIVWQKDLTGTDVELKYLWIKACKVIAINTPLQEDTTSSSKKRVKL